MPGSVLALSIRKQGRKIVIEDLGTVIVRVLSPTGAPVTRAEIALGIVDGARLGRDALHLSLPRAFGAMLRNQNPVARADSACDGGCSPKRSYLARSRCGTAWVDLGYGPVSAMVCRTDRFSKSGGVAGFHQVHRAAAKPSSRHSCSAHAG